LGNKIKWKKEVDQAKVFIKFAFLGYVPIIVIGALVSIILIYSIFGSITALKIIESLLLGFAIGSSIVFALGKFLGFQISDKTLLDAPTPSDRVWIETELLPKLRGAKGNIEKYAVITLIIMFLNILKDLIKFLGSG